MGNYGRKKKVSLAVIYNLSGNTHFRANNNKKNFMQNIKKPQKII